MTRSFLFAALLLLASLAGCVHTPRTPRDSTTCSGPSVITTTVAEDGTSSTKVETACEEPPPPTPDTSPPTIPANFIATVKGTSEIEWTWEASEDQTGIADYVFKWFATMADCEANRKGTVVKLAGDVLRYSLTGLAPSTERAAFIGAHDSTDGYLWSGTGDCVGAITAPTAASYWFEGSADAPTPVVFGTPPNGWYSVGAPTPLVTAKRAATGEYSYQCVYDYETAAEDHEKRCEMKIDGSGEWVTKERKWPQRRAYGFAIFLENWQQETQKGAWEIVHQNHRTSDADDASGCNPNLALSVETSNNHYVMTIRGDPNPTTQPECFGQVGTNIDLGPIKPNQWESIAYDINWSPDTDGWIRIYRDCELIVAPGEGDTGYTKSRLRTAINNKIGPHFKVGIYKGKWWDGSPSPGIAQRVDYYDNVVLLDPTGKDWTPQQVRDSVCRPPTTGGRARWHRATS